jgi:hypothetical protein
VSQHYSDLRREQDEHALPDVETWQEYPGGIDYRGERIEAGWYYWFCLPGCLPDSDPVGPFASEDEALADAREDDET